MELKGSKTEQNLMTAFAGESQARNKYTYYASKAKKDGYEQIAAIFEETANNEKEHAKMWFKELNGGDIPKTEENLLAHSISLIYFSNDERKYYFNSVYNNVRSYINICNEDRELVIYILKNILKNKYQLKIIKYNPLIIKRID